jgi:hypothetical protein
VYRKVLAVLSFSALKGEILFLFCKNLTSTEIAAFLQVGSEFVEGHVDGFQIFGEKVTDY